MELCSSKAFNTTRILKKKRIKLIGMHFCGLKFVNITDPLIRSDKNSCTEIEFKLYFSRKNLMHKSSIETHYMISGRIILKWNFFQFSFDLQREQFCKHLIIYQMINAETLQSECTAKNFPPTKRLPHRPPPSHLNHLLHPPALEPWGGGKFRPGGS